MRRVSVKLCEARVITDWRFLICFIYLTGIKHIPDWHKQQKVVVATWVREAAVCWLKLIPDSWGAAVNTRGSQVHQNFTLMHQNVTQLKKHSTLSWTWHPNIGYVLLALYVKRDMCTHKVGDCGLQATCTKAGILYFETLTYPLFWNADLSYCFSLMISYP